MQVFSRNSEKQWTYAILILPLSFHSSDTSHFLKRYGMAHARKTLDRLRVITDSAAAWRTGAFCAT